MTNLEIVNAEYFNSLQKYEQDSVLEHILIANEDYKDGVDIEWYIENEVCDDEAGWLDCVIFAKCMGLDAEYISGLEDEQMQYIYFNIK